MKFTLSWLKDYLDTSATLDEIIEGLIGVGFEVEEVVDKSKRPVVLAVPFMDWEHLAANGMATGGSNHKLGIPAKVAAIEYDPNRSARLALLHYADGEKRYILCPDGLVVGKTVVSGEGADILPGNSMPIQQIPAGTIIHNIELRPGKGAQMVRTAGAFAQLIAKEGDYSQIKLPSGEIRKVHVLCKATIGQVGNAEHKNVKHGKAGRKRWLGKKPHNRGVSMNPVDHPHGGGEGRTSGGRHPVTPWGKPTKGYKTRRNKRTQSMIVKRRK